VNKIRLEYSKTDVLFPRINFFIDNIRNNKPFHFIRINHGILDLIFLGHDNISNFEKSFQNGNFKHISNRMFIGDKRDENTPIKKFHKDSNSDDVKSKMEILLKVLKEYGISDKIQIGVSLGIGLNTLHGVLDKSHPLQIGRDETINIINKNTNSQFYYSGVLKHYTIKKEIFKLFEELNSNKFKVVFVGMNYMKFFEDIFKIDNFRHINIPWTGAINNIDEYIDEIKEIRKTNEKVMVMHSTGHILSSYIAHELKDTDIFGLDIGRSFDLLVSHIKNEGIGSYWPTKEKLDKYIEYVDTVRHHSDLYTNSINN
jgi:hypothetical protein